MSKGERTTWQRKPHESHNLLSAYRPRYTSAPPSYTLAAKVPGACPERSKAGFVCNKVVCIDNR
jgi:hypothetical protein